MSITIAVNFKSNKDSTGHYKKITISITDSSIPAVSLRAETLTNELHNIDGRDWDWSLPITVV